MEQFIDNLIDTPLGLYWIAFATFLGSLSTLAQALAVLLKLIAGLTSSTRDDEYANTFSNGAERLAAFIQRFAVVSKKPNA